MNNIVENYELWCQKALGDSDLLPELEAMDQEAKEDAFYRNLAFGTGGLRGLLGAGTNRMNIYTVAKASQGLADYVKAHVEQKDWKIAVGYDSRIKSYLFSEVAARVFAANGINVYLYRELMPTPCVSFAVRELGCAAGIVITASHNPAQYNGYKVYGADGCQITTEAAEAILKEIEKLDLFEDVKIDDFKDAMSQGKIEYIPTQIYDRYIEAVLDQSVLRDDRVDKNLRIVYSPLNGAGLKPVLRTLEEAGYTQVKVVKEQEEPDGHFPTCPYPNPETKEAMKLGIDCAKDYDADLLLATDPDCDRCGIAVKDKKGELVLLSGNEVGVLLLDYLCSQRKKHKTMPEDPLCIKTIVTTDLAEDVAKAHGIKLINVLTGFKYIGEQIGLLEKEGKEDSFLFGFEESYGYLAGSYVRDKDAVVAVFLICEMFAYYKQQGISLTEKLEDIYATYGYSQSNVHSYTFEGSRGLTKMQEIMAMLRKGLEKIGKQKVVALKDYLQGIEGLPKSDVLKFFLEGNCSVVIRPSGTEPKLKAYVSVQAQSKEEAQDLEHELVESLNQLFV